MRMAERRLRRVLTSEKRRARVASRTSGAVPAAGAPSGPWGPRPSLADASPTTASRGAGEFLRILLRLLRRLALLRLIFARR